MDNNNPLNDFDPETFDWNSIYHGDERDFVEAEVDILRIARSLVPGKALDIGCGAGGTALALAEMGWTVHGIDISPRAIEAAKKRDYPDHARLSFEVADATEWQPGDSYDLVVNSFALPMKQDEQQAVFGCAASALRPGERVIIKDFDPKMSRIEHFRGIHMPSVQEFKEAFAGWSHNFAQVIPTKAHRQDPNDPAKDKNWSAVLFHSQKPL